MSNTSLLGSYGGLGESSLMFRNRIINGGMDIWQRGTSQTSSGYGSDDRWSNRNVGSTKTHSRQAFILGQTDVPGNPQYFSRTVVSSVAGVGNLVAKFQKIESVATFAGQTATLSFWAKADAPKNMAVEFAQDFGSGGSPSAAVLSIGVTTIALTTAWKYYTVTVNVPSIAGKTLGTDGNDALLAQFWFEAGSDFNARTNSLGQQSGTFDIAQVQMEAGAVATPFERRPIGVELGMAMRYCEIAPEVSSIRLLSNGSYTGSQTVLFKIPKRGTTTVTVYGTGGYPNNPGFYDRDGLGNTATTTTTNLNGFIVNISAGASGFCAYRAEAEL
jgi:hypothetical protein